MNVLCPGFTVLAPEWTCNKQCNYEVGFRKRKQKGLKKHPSSFNEQPNTIY